MTKQEKIVVSAYTGFLMCKFGDLHEYIEKKFNRPVFTHEMGSPIFLEELRNKCRDEFMAICKEEE